MAEAIVALGRVPFVRVERAKCNVCRTTYDVVRSDPIDVAAYSVFLVGAMCITYGIFSSMWSGRVPLFALDGPVSSLVQLKVCMLVMGYLRNRFEDYTKINLYEEYLRNL